MNTMNTIVLFVAVALLVPTQAIKTHEYAALQSGAKTQSQPQAQDVDALVSRFDATSDAGGVVDDDGIVDIICLLRDFETTATELANNKQATASFCSNRDLTGYTLVNGTDVTLPKKVTYTQNEFVLSGGLHCKLWETDELVIAAYRHMEGDASGDTPDARYALKKYAWEGAYVTVDSDSPLSGKQLHKTGAETLSAIGGFYYRHRNNPLKELFTTSYKTLAADFITKIASQKVSGGKKLVATGYSLGGGLAQIVGLENLTPSVDLVLSFSGNGPITKNNRNRSGAKIINFVIKNDVTQQIGCHSSDSKVCVIGGIGAANHEAAVYGNGPEKLADKLAKTKKSKKKVTNVDLNDDLVLCLNGQDYSQMCCACRREKTHPNFTFSDQDKTTQAQLVKHSICKKLPKKT